MLLMAVARSFPGRVMISQGNFGENIYPTSLTPYELHIGLVHAAACTRQRQTLDCKRWTSLLLAAKGDIYDFLVCLFVCTHTYFKTTRPNFTNFSVHVTCDRGSVSSDDNVIRYVLPVLWMTLWIELLMSQNQRRHVYIVDFVR